MKLPLEWYFMLFGYKLRNVVKYALLLCYCWCWILCLCYLLRFFQNMRQHCDNFETSSGPHGVLWGSVLLPCGQYVPCWFVGWWLWHAGCNSQDTYLLYEIMFRQGGKILNDFWRCDLGEMLHNYRTQVWSTIVNACHSLTTFWNLLDVTTFLKNWMNWVN